MGIRVILKGCDDSTEFELVCTKEQYSFLKELANATKVISTFSCMPVIDLYNRGSEEDAEELPINSDNLKFVEEVSEYGDDLSYYELDTTKL